MPTKVHSVASLLPLILLLQTPAAQSQELARSVEVVFAPESSCTARIVDEAEAFSEQLSRRRASVG